MNDEILDEIRAIREAHAAAFHFDLDAIYADIKQREMEHQAQGRRFVDPPATEWGAANRSEALGISRRVD